MATRAASSAKPAARGPAADGHDEALPAPRAHAALAVLAAAPLLVAVDPNFNVVATAAAAVYVGCWRSAKAAGPAESMSRKVRG
jgi:minor histocompatibility antigen H13